MERLVQRPAAVFGRHYATVDDRLVHVRMAGEGPTVVLMHDSPRSSRRLSGLATALAPRFHVLALDTPGFGGSDALSLPVPRIEDLAESARSTLDQLGVERAVVYGTHTSSKIALELALRHPRRVAALVLDGISMQSEPQRRRFLEGEYLKGSPAMLDGAHLAALWAKMLDQFRFFPYDDRTLRSRLKWALPTPTEMDEHLLDLLEAGPDFGRTYAAAFRYDAAPRLPLLDTPTSIVCRSDDVLVGDLARLPALPRCVNVAELPADPAAWLDAIVERIGRHSASASTGRPEPVVPASNYSGRRFLGPPGRQLHVHFYARPSGRTVCVLPDVPGCAPSVLDVARSLATRLPVVVPDFPGCGDSDAVGAPLSVGALADSVISGLEELGVLPVVILAPTWSSPIAIAMAHRHPLAVSELVLDGVLCLDTHQQRLVESNWPDVAAERAGSHLFRAWHFLRDQTLAWPWCDNSTAGIRATAPELDPVRLQSQLVGLLKQRESAIAVYRELAASAGKRSWPRLAQPVSVLEVEGDPAYAGVSAFVGDLPQARRLFRSPRRTGIAAVLFEALGIRSSP